MAFRRVLLGQGCPPHKGLIRTPPGARWRPSWATTPSRPISRPRSSSWNLRRTAS